MRSVKQSGLPTAGSEMIKEIETQSPLDTQTQGQIDLRSHRYTVQQWTSLEELSSHSSVQTQCLQLESSDGSCSVLDEDGMCGHDQHQTHWTQINHQHEEPFFCSKAHGTVPHLSISNVSIFMMLNYPVWFPIGGMSVTWTKVLCTEH